MPDLLIDPSPFQVVHLSPLSEVHFMFIMLRCSHLFVTRFGRLIGYIMLKDLMHNDQNTRHKIKTVDTQPALPK
ncbi:hypothetical protein SARC_12749 [Sphaeroforma arctica JP610]|uniref:CBS domain-containing protein n=1 Tax=Sphaeroforma arctica JP610 TaxID=667725 RepID=A0A0L0FD84_9EUKA|nr:hypothetical protein SARC_12749 [Sphaeroforma arctica JP610]KNC74712.1 hypothetical protein SARC_12749 [Sphaeroforma arctica JP610]|eukprot:XP_014148614.1 hypothetical protein SARC_12749 [Sphaeroforma arctica JP610]